MNFPSRWSRRNAGLVVAILLGLALAQAPPQPVTNVHVNAGLGCATAICTTLGTLTLTPTFDNIGVKLTYTNDSNTNNSATLQYRVQGSGTWLDAHTAAYATTANWPDRRTTCCASDNGGAISNAANQNQFRASIVGLTAGTTYEVQTVITDPDGVSASGTQTGTVTLLSTSTLAPQSGTTKYLDSTAGGGGDGSNGTPYNTLAAALGGTSCGDTVEVKATSGSVSTGGSLTRSCATTNWFQIHCASQAAVIFTEGAGATANLTISASAGIRIDNCRFGPSSDSVISLTNASHDIWLNSLYQEDGVNGGTNASHCSTSRLYEANIKILDGAGHITITNSTILAPTLASFATVCADHSESDGRAIMFGSGANPSTAGRYIIKGNTFSGGWGDGLGNSPENQTNVFDDSDILNNTFAAGVVDDAMQFEGSDINVRFGGNTLTVGTTGTAALATQTGFYGPIYKYRNFLDYSGGSYVLKNGGTEAEYDFHNTMLIRSSIGGVYCWGDSVGSTTPQRYIVAVNNICKAVNGAVLQRIATTSVFDYNVQFRTGTPLVEEWGGVTYNTLANFQACPTPCQEAHGVSSNPNLDAALHISNTSPAYNVGVTIPNFNDATSAWPATHGAPDIGAYEVP